MLRVIGKLQTGSGRAATAFLAVLIAASYLVMTLRTTFLILSIGPLKQPLPIVKARR